MDPFSITASAVSIVTFALQAVKLLHDDIQNIKNAPHVIKDCMADLEALEPMLTILHDKNEDELTRDHQIFVPVQNCRTLCEAFMKQLRDWAKHDSDGKMVISSRVKMGLLGQETIKTFKEELCHYKATLTCVLVAKHYIEAPREDAFSTMIAQSEQQLGQQLAQIETEMQQLQLESPKETELYSKMDENHQETKQHLAEVATKGQVVDIGKEIDRLRNEFASVSALKTEISSIADRIPAKTPAAEEVTRLGDYLLLTTPDQDRSILVDTMGQPVNETCRWIFQKDLFRAWVTANPAFLWLRGDTGKGKTMFSIFLSGILHEQTCANAHIISYFCSKQDEKRNTAASILRSLLWQLTTKPQLTEVIAKHLAEHAKPLLSEHEALWNLFAALALDSSCGKIYCILDGCDELQDGSEVWLVNKLLSLFAPGPREPERNVLRLLLVSRDIPGFKLRGQSGLLDLDTECKDDVDTDIVKVVDAKLSTVPDWTNINDEYKTQVRSEIILKAAGSFVPINIIVNAILHRPYSGILETIRSLPEGLDALYGSTLLSIQSTEQHQSPEILQWVAMAYRPLSLRELAEAVGQDLDDVAIRATVQRCGALLTIHEDKVILSHNSLRDYLLRKDGEQSSSLDTFDPKQKEAVHRFLIDPQEAHFEIAMRCLQLIKESHLQHRAMDSKDEWEGSPLLQYAVLYWGIHARESGAAGKRIFESTSFVLSNDAIKLQQNWWRTYIHERPGQEWEQGERLSPLHIACRFGITEWVRTLLSEIGPRTLKGMIDEADVNGMTPLAWAVTGGHSHVAALLLDKGADIEARTSLYSREGAGWLHSRAVKSYLREAKTGDGMWTGYHTPLYRACYKGHASTVKLLLDRGAKVHACGFAWASPMHAVAIGGNIDVLRLLLEYGRDEQVNATLSGSYTIPLHYAVENGHIEIVRMLLDHGADIKRQQRYSRAAVLHFAAVKTPHPATVELLLERGADVHVRDSHLRKPIHCFVMKHPEPEAVKLLMDYGSSVNKLNSLRRTALDISIDCMCDRCQATTRVLLAHNGALLNPSEIGRKNHPELFKEGDSLQPLPEMMARVGSTVLSSEDGRSVSQALQASTADDSLSLADTQSISREDVLTGDTSISIAESNQHEDDVQSVGAATQGSESHGLRKRDRFKAKMRRFADKVSGD